MKKAEEYQEIILAFVALLLVAILVFLLIQMVTLLGGSLNKAISPVRPEDVKIQFNLDGAQNLNLNN